MYLLILTAGIFGGVTRGLVGFIKHQFAYKNVPFKPFYFLGMSLMSGLIGLAAAVSVQGAGFQYLGGFSPYLAFIVGYAGGDFIENIYKIIIKKSSLYPKADKTKN